MAKKTCALSNNVIRLAESFRFRKGPFGFSAIALEFYPVWDGPIVRVRSVPRKALIRNWVYHGRFLEIDPELSFCVCGEHGRGIFSPLSRCSRAEGL